MRDIQQLILKIIEINSEFGELSRSPLPEQNILELRNKIKKIYGRKLSQTYIEILRLTNGVNFNGVFLYGSDDNPSMDIVKCNEDWHNLEEFQDYFFYADSDMYLFVEDEEEVYTIRGRDDFQTIIFETIDDKLFFEKILQCSLGIDIEE